MLSSYKATVAENSYSQLAKATTWVFFVRSKLIHAH